MSVFYPYLQHLTQSEPVASNGNPEGHQAELPNPPLKTETKRAKIERKRKKKKEADTIKPEQENEHTQEGGYFLMKFAD